MVATGGGGSEVVRAQVLHQRGERRVKSQFEGGPEHARYLRHKFLRLNRHCALIFCYHFHYVVQRTRFGRTPTHRRNASANPPRAA